MNEHGCQTLIIEDGVEEINQGQYVNNFVEKVVVPSCITSIGDNAFKNWKKLRIVVFAKDS